MFDWVVDGVRYIGWIIYAGMLYFVSSIYNTLTSIPNSLSNVINNDTVNSLFTASRNLFIVFVSLMIVVIVLSRMFDWNVNKMMNQMKKIFILCLILIALPWIFNQATKITNSFIASSNNVMVDENNNSTTTDLGVSMANIYIYRNDKYESSKDYGEADEDPFHNLGDVTDGEIINRKIKYDGDDVYVYSYLNPILGLILNIALIGLLILTTFKVYGYLYNIVVIKIWIPIKMIYDGFNDTPVSEAIYEIVSAFTSFAIQLIIIPFSVIMLGVFTAQINDNLFLEIVSVFVALWFMFTGVDYIQTKFQGKSGVPTVLEAYTTMKLMQAGVNTAKSVLPSGGDKVTPTDFASKNLDDDNINTGREQDIQSEHDDSTADGMRVNDSAVSDEISQSDNQSVNNIDETIDNDIANDNLQANQEQLNNDNVFDNDDYMSSMMNQTADNQQVVNDNDDINLNKDEMNNINEDMNMRGNDNEPQISNSATTEPKEENIGNNVVNDNNLNQTDTPNINNTGGNINVEDKSPNISFPATEKQIEFAKSLGIETEGKNKYELGNEIQDITTGRKSNYVEPKYDTPKLDSNDTMSVKELEKMLKNDSGFD